MAVDVANLPGVTSDESMETKLIICGLLGVESDSEYELGKYKCAKCGANHPEDAIDSRQLLSINFYVRFL